METYKTILVDPIISKYPPSERLKLEATEFLHNIYLEQKSQVVEITFNDHTQQLVNVLIDHLDYLFSFEAIFCSCMDVDKCKCKYGKTLQQCITTKFFIDYWKPK